MNYDAGVPGRVCEKAGASEEAPALCVPATDRRRGDSDECAEDRAGRRPGYADSSTSSFFSTDAATLAATAGGASS